ncbi:hypothetical protein BJX76DRAFT_339665 [Aspergillus varians]
MPEEPDPRTNGGLMERMFQRRPSQTEADIQPEQTLERPTSQEGDQPPLRRPRRNSALQKLKEYMHSEEELDEAGKVYAKLM